MLGLQLVFRLGVLLTVLALLIAVMADDLKDLPCKALAITSLLFLAFYGQNSIGPYHGKAIVSALLFALFSLVSLFFLFFSSLFALNFLGLIFLFGLVGLTLALLGRAGFLSSFQLIISEIETDLQGLFSLGVPVV